METSFKMESECLMKIALLGKMRSGKDTVAKYFVENLDFKEYKLSTGITEIVNTYLSDSKTKASTREIYQTIGETMRSLDGRVWVDKLLRDVENNNDMFKNVIVSDVRNEKDVEILSSKGFVIVEVYADDEVRMERILKSSNEPFEHDRFYHYTETGIDNISKELIDIRINNNGSLQELQSTLGNLFI